MCQTSVSALCRRLQLQQIDLYLSQKCQSSTVGNIFADTFHENHTFLKKCQSSTVGTKLVDTLESRGKWTRGAGVQRAVHSTTLDNNLMWLSLAYTYRGLIHSLDYFYWGVGNSAIVPGFVSYMYHYWSRIYTLPNNTETYHYHNYLHTNTFTN